LKYNISTMNNYLNPDILGICETFLKEKNNYI